MDPPGTVAVSATSAPSPATRVCTCVSVTLNGASTTTLGAAVSVEPVTATLPVAPGRVHSGATSASGAAVGQVESSAAVLVIAGALPGALTVAESGSEPHALRLRASTVRPAAAVRAVRTGKGYTVLTLQARGRA